MALDILIVDDEKDICSLVADILGDEGYECRVAHSGQQALDAIRKRRPHLILQDIWLGESSFDGLKILELVKADHPDLPVVMMSGHGTIETAVSAVKLGAYDFLEKPFNSNRLIVLVERALDHSSLRQENQTLKQHAVLEDEALVGSSPVAQLLKEMVSKVAPTNSRVLLEGPHGTGKETIAKAIHKNSPRASASFVVLNCAGLSCDHLDERLFGAERETGISTGVFEQAHNGTLYLDAVDEMSLETQGLMVKALQRNEFQRVGGKTLVNVDVRVIASTSFDLKALVDAKVFREDLYYRLNVVRLEVKALAERKGDIPDLATHFFSLITKQQDQPVRPIGIEAMGALSQYNWPGNIRQLRNVMEHVWILMQNTSATEVGIDDLPAEIFHNRTEEVEGNETGLNSLFHLLALPLREAREQFEKEYLEAQMIRFGGNISKTADFVQMERSALHRKLKGLELVSKAS